MTETSLNSPKDYILHYLKDLKLSVFILKNPDTGTEEELKDRKRPALNWHPYQSRFAFEAEVDNWFKFCANYNVAIVCGSISKIVAFDVDNGAGTAAKRVEEQRMNMSTNLRVALDNTMMNKTGSGGTHIIFRIEDDISDISQKILWSDGQPHSQILMQGNGHYIAGAPSRHPNGNFYEWNGKAPHLITRQELNEFIRLMSPEQQIESRPQQTTDVVVGQSLMTSTTTPKTTTDKVMTLDETQRLFKWVKKLYTSGDRDFVVFFLSGTMRKDAGYSHETTRNFFTLLSNASEYSDEDLDKTLKTVDRTYRMPLNEISGKAGLDNEIVKSHEGSADYQERVEAFSRICQIINGEPESPNNNHPPDDGDHDKGKEGEEGEREASNPDTPGAWLSSMLKEANKEEKEINVVEVLTKEIFSLNHFRTLEDTNEILWYHNGVWEHGGENRIKSILDHLARYCVKTHTVNEVLETIRRATLTPRAEFDNEIYLINCRNCIIDLRTGKALEHDPKYLFTQQIPWDYRPNQIRTCKRNLQFLDEVVHRSDKRLVLEYIGYTLIRNCFLQKALICVGPPNQGKSKFEEMVQTFFGKKNVSNKSLHQLTGDRFSTSALFGKYANIFADLSNERLKDISMFNVLVAGDRINAEKKNKDSFDFEPFAKLYFSANLPPLPPEGITNEEAFYKRWFVVSFMLKAGVEIDPNLLEKLTTEEEMSGLLYIAVGCAGGLIKRGRFSKNPSIEETWEEYEKKANPIKAWVSARCVINQQYQTGKDRLEADFIDYCESKQLPGYRNRIKFGQELKELYSVEHGKEGPKGNQKPVWKGIALRKDLRGRGELDLDIWGEGEGEGEN